MRKNNDEVLIYKLDGMESETGTSLKWERELRVFAAHG